MEESPKDWKAKKLLNQPRADDKCRVCGLEIGASVVVECDDGWRHYICEGQELCQDK